MERLHSYLETALQGNGKMLASIMYRWHKEYADMMMASLDISSNATRDQYLDDYMFDYGDYRLAMEYITVNSILSGADIRFTFTDDNGYTKSILGLECPIRNTMWWSAIRVV